MPPTIHRDPTAPAPHLTAALARAHIGDARAWDDLQALHAQVQPGSAARLQAAAGLLVTGQLQRRFAGLPQYLDELTLLQNGSAGLGAEQELLALNGLLIGLMFYRPLDPAIDACAARLQARVKEGLDVNLTLAAARTLNYYFDARQLREPALRVYALMCARVDEAAATPYRHAEWLNVWRRCVHYGKQPELAEQAVVQMRALARRHGLRGIEFEAALADFDIALPRVDLSAARTAIELAEAVAGHAVLHQLVSLEFAKTRFAYMRADADSALHHAVHARKLATELQMPPMMQFNYIIGEALARLLGEDFEGARSTLQETLGQLSPAYAGEVDAMLEGIEVYLAVRDALPGCAARLATLWRGLRERRSYDLFVSMPEFGTRLCVMALDRDIETDFVRSLIAKCQLAAPGSAPANWPWPLRIQALGGFAVWRDGVLLATEGKAQRKPLALLQALIALGGLREERGVEVTRLIELLWPDDDVADPKASFEAALSRLRKWLRLGAALKLVEGRLSLNARVVWCDVGAFEQLCDQLRQVLQPHTDAAALPGLLAQLNALYVGKLFGSATLEPWSVLARERHALRFSRAVGDAGAHMETHRRWTDALHLYEAGLLQDMLAEPIHRALLRCHLSLGQHTDAKRAFERCCRVLQAELGLPPSAETLALMARSGAPR